MEPVFLIQSTLSDIEKLNAVFHHLKGILNLKLSKK